MNSLYSIHHGKNINSTKYRVSGKISALIFFPGFMNVTGIFSFYHNILKNSKIFLRYSPTAYIAGFVFFFFFFFIKPNYFVSLQITNIGFNPAKRYEYAKPIFRCLPISFSYFCNFIFIMLKKISSLSKVLVKGKKTPVL